MLTLNSTKNNTMFYFDNVEQLTDFDSFVVCPVINDNELNKEEPVCWSVIGKLNSEKTSGLSGNLFPVADLPNEMYAEMFADMCRTIIEASSGSLNSGSLKHNHLVQSISA